MSVTTDQKGQGAVHKDVRSQGEGFVQCSHFADKGGSLDADVYTFWYKKTSDFLKFMVCPYGQGDNFPRFCADVFYGRPLTIFNKPELFRNRLKSLVIVLTSNLFRVFMHACKNSTSQLNKSASPILLQFEE